MTLHKRSSCWGSFADKLFSTAESNSSILSWTTETRNLQTICIKRLSLNHLSNERKQMQK